MKTIQEVVESSSSISRRPRPREDHPSRRLLAMPPGGLHIRWPDAPLEQEARLMDYKWYAALAYIRANKPTTTSSKARPLRHHCQRQGPTTTCAGPRIWALDDDTCRQPRHPVHKVNVVAAGSHHHPRLCAGPARDSGGGGKRQVIEYQPRKSCTTGALMCAPTCWASSTKRATTRAANGACPTLARTGCCAPRPT